MENILFILIMLIFTVLLGAFVKLEIDDYKFRKNRFVPGNSFMMGGGKCRGTHSNDHPIVIYRRI